MDGVTANQYEHRHYTSYNPCCNRLLSMKWDQAQRNKHIRKLQKMKHALDNAPPRKFKHLDVKMKKIQLEKDRQDEINRDNQTLIKRMSCLMHRHNNLTTLNMDPYKYQILEMTESKRNRNIKTIHQENLGILQRLEYKAPYYDHRRWIKERHQTLGYLLSISMYPEQYIAQYDRYERNRAKREEEREKLINHDGTTPKQTPKAHPWRKPPLPNIPPKEGGSTCKPASQENGGKHLVPVKPACTKKGPSRPVQKREVPTSQKEDETKSSPPKKTAGSKATKEKQVAKTVPQAAGSKQVSKEKPKEKEDSNASQKKENEVKQESEEAHKASDQPASPVEKPAAETPVAPVAPTESKPAQEEKQTASEEEYSFEQPSDSEKKASETKEDDYKFDGDDVKGYSSTGEDSKKPGEQKEEQKNEYSDDYASPPTDE